MYCSVIYYIYEVSEIKKNNRGDDNETFKRQLAKYLQELAT